MPTAGIPEQGGCRTAVSSVVSESALLPDFGDSTGIRKRRPLPRLAASSVSARVVDRFREAADGSPVEAVPAGIDPAGALRQKRE